MIHGLSSQRVTVNSQAPELSRVVVEPDGQQGWKLVSTFWWHFAFVPEISVRPSSGAGPWLTCRQVTLRKEPSFSETIVDFTDLNVSMLNWAEPAAWDGFYYPTADGVRRVQLSRLPHPRYGGPTGQFWGYFLLPENKSIHFSLTDNIAVNHFHVGRTCDVYLRRLSGRGFRLSTCRAIGRAQLA